MFLASSYTRRYRKFSIFAKKRNTMRCCTFLFLLFLTRSLVSQTAFPAINSEIENGNFTQAQQLIQQELSSGKLTAAEAWELRLQSDILDRIRLDFGRDEAYVRE